MTTENFNNILKNPSQLQLSDLPLLTNLIDKHPYFQAPRAIRLKLLKNQESYLYNQKLKETAAYTVDRSILFDFITSKTFNTSTVLEETVSNKQTITNETTETVTFSSDNETNSKEDFTPIATDVTDEAIKMTSDEANQIIDPFLFEEKKPEELPVETALNIEAPLPFKKGETHSFTEWLKLASLQPIVRNEEEKEVISVPATPKKKLIESSLIDNFIKNNPKISPVKKDSPTVNLATRNPVPTEDLMTETLAKVYLAQKNYKKAIQAYKILSLKNPEKSGLFADRIRAIEKLQHNK